MICIGALGAYHTLAHAPSLRQGFVDDGVAADIEIPERAAEAYLDAWRRRDFARARQLSRGRALDAVEQRVKQSAIQGADTVAMESLWQQLAKHGLRFVVYESIARPNQGLALLGVAEGELLEQPYRREVEFLLKPEGSAWYVEHMQLGDILAAPSGAARSDAPAALATQTAPPADRTSRDDTP